jgi:IMP dehydrogenase
MGVLLSDKALSFDDVLLVPQFSSVYSRKEISLDTYVTNEIHLQTPLIASNMPSVTGWELASKMWDLGGMGILPRFGVVKDAVMEYKAVRTYGAECGVSLGVEGDSDLRAKELYNAGARIFCVDVAHGHHYRVTDLIEKLRVEYGDTIEIIAGNVATSLGCSSLAEAGADAIKVGIGPGAACSTREVTGFGVPQLSALFECAQAKEIYPNLRIIADGGIKNSGDIVKALVFGADAVMIGRLFAGANEAPHPGEYFGNASSRVRDYRAPEGVEGAVDIEGPLEDIVKKLNWGIKSGLSYAGCESIDELHGTDIDYMVVSPQTMNETRTRI